MWPWRPSGVRSKGIGAVVAVLAARKQMLQWGATASEVRAVLPGDELLRSADLVSTRAIAIRATPADVWPWVVQLGQGRGGFYSYDRLENLVGCEIHSADRIVPDWQHLDIGDAVRLAPEMALHVACIDTGRALVLRGGAPIGKMASPFDFTWAFVLCESADGSSRLLVRERYRFVRWWAALIVEPSAAVSFVMTQRMLRGIRDRAERDSRST